MGRTAFPVLKDKLLEIITEQDVVGKFNTQAELFDGIAEAYNLIEDIPQKITPSVVRLRAISWDVQFNILPGKRGRKKGDAPNKNINIQNSGDVCSNQPTSKLGKQSIEEIKKLCTLNECEKYHKLVDKIGKGNLKNAVHLNCIICLGFDASEISTCQELSCVFWNFRKYK